MKKAFRNSPGSRRVRAERPAVRARIRAVAMAAGLGLALSVPAAAPEPPVAPASAAPVPPPVSSHQAARARPVARGAGPHYLPAVGPAPLRIQPPARPPAGGVVLPPLVMKDPEPARVDPSAGAAATNGLASAAGSSATNRPPVLADLPPISTEAGATLVTEVGAGDVIPQPIFTPQMLVQFFKPYGSNLVGGVWNVPAFLPPPSVPTRSSSATYRSP